MADRNRRRRASKTLLGRGIALAAVAVCHFAAIAAIAGFGWPARPEADNRPMMVAVLVPAAIPQPVIAAPMPPPRAEASSRPAPISTPQPTPRAHAKARPASRRPAPPPPPRKTVPPAASASARSASEPEPPRPGEPEPNLEPAPPQIALQAPAEIEASMVAPVEPSTSPASFDAAYLANPPPRYPLAARRMGEQGTVLLLVQVGESGRVAGVAVSRSSGSDRLDRAALETVANWRFEPARRGSIAVAAAVEVPIVFRLEN